MRNEKNLNWMCKASNLRIKIQDKKASIKMNHLGISLSLLSFMTSGLTRNEMSCFDKLKLNLFNLLKRVWTRSFW